MAYVLDPACQLNQELRRVLDECLNDATSLLDGLEPKRDKQADEVVHRVRKRCKESRALARLVRNSVGPAYARFNDLVHDAAALLAPIRDTHAVLATFEGLQAGRAGLAQQAIQLTQGDLKRVRQARKLLRRAKKATDQWPLEDKFAPLAHAVDRNYRRGRRAMRRAAQRPTVKRLHAWRKSVKTLGYHMRLIEQAAPSVLTPLVGQFDALAETLGDDHDLAVLIERMIVCPENFGGTKDAMQAGQLAGDRQGVLRERAFRLGQTLYAEKPSAFTQRVRDYWKNARRLGPERPDD